MRFAPHKNECIKKPSTGDGFDITHRSMSFQQIKRLQLTERT